MCGIVGAYSLVTENHKIIELVQKILVHQKFRGPDFTGSESFTLFNHQLILGHNRLSIIDLSSESNQPFYNKERTHCIVFNGEIYNYVEIRNELRNLGHSFSTESDTEVLLSAFITWGAKALNKFNGMFALAILDINAKKIFLARDRFGVKPLYYYFDRKTFVFCSTTEKIAEYFRLNPNLNYLSKGLRYWIYEDESIMTQYEKLNALQPGHFIEVSIDESNLSINDTLYYDLRKAVLTKKETLVESSETENIDEFIQSFNQSVKLRLRADVKVGISLSGGLDSSTIASFASNLSREVVGVNYGRPDRLESEGPLVKLLGEKLQIETQFIWPTEKEMLEAFWDSFDAQESPIYGLSYIAEFLVYKFAKDLGIKVMLGGQGGDESFMGYRKYLILYLRSLIRNKEISKSGYLMRDILKSLYYQRKHIKGFGLSLRRYLNSSGIRPNLNLPTPQFNLSFDGNKELWERQVLDVLTTSVPTQLKSEDRNSMRNSIETRLPFLDYNVVELGLALDNNMKLRDGYGKWIVRKATEGRVPDNIRWARYKRGFDVTQNLMGSGLGLQINERLNDNFSKIKDFVSSQDALKIYSGENMNESNLLFQEAMTLLWLIKNPRS